ncbi:flagellar hook-basal body protein [Paenibacillus koleovorans]|uniref:flagellar hook-basal body protein n=1 Tax=Paenibacillus koleovorans TaxID=121608 RepID=UPI000FDCCFE5|nr:flagellar hook-basal body protein [Paenibacillus koleovorans]
MNHSMINSLVTMKGLQQKLDVIANNMANINTTGFKRAEVTFHDVLTTTMQQPAEFQQSGRMSPMGLTQGWGAKISSIQTQMSQGSLKETNLPTDIAIEGNALFEIAIQGVDENGLSVATPAWTRDGTFSLNARPEDPDNVYLMTKQGFAVLDVNDQPIRIPNYHKLKVTENGTVLATSEQDPSEPALEVGQLKLVQIVRPQVLQQLGDNLYTMPADIDPALGEIVRVVAADPNNPKAEQLAVRQGFVEQSNVTLADEMTELMLTQRAFQLNAKALASADNLMGLTNQLRS